MRNKLWPTVIQGPISGQALMLSGSPKVDAVTVTPRPSFQREEARKVRFSKVSVGFPL